MTFFQEEDEEMNLINFLKFFQNKQQLESID